MPKFSICLPVRNGWPFIKDCVNSILNQTYPEFELHVLDNCSTDNTLDWLNSLDDPRISISRSTNSLSIVESWARILEVEKHEFMTLIGHDDILYPKYLATIKSMIESHPEAGLYFTGGDFINANGRVMRKCRPVAEIESAADYLEGRLTFQRDVFGSGYVMRSSDYDKLGGIPEFERLLFADDALWLSMLKNRYKVTNSNTHFAIRIHPESESASLPSFWSPVLAGLRQFNEFLQPYLEDVPDARRVYEKHGETFMLNYHRNAYIFALIEACEKKHPIKEEVVETIANSLRECAPLSRARLSDSPKVAIISALNASPARVFVPYLWRAYYWIKNR